MNYYINENGSLCEVSDQALMHYGVKGMKWGVRRYADESGRLTAAGKKRYIADKTKSIQRDIDSFAPHRKTGIRAKNGKLLMDTKEIDGIVSGLEKEKSKTAAKAAKKYDKAVRKDAIKSTARDLNKKATLGEKLTYNDATRRKAAKYIVDNKMSVDDAMKKAKGDAWRNTAAFMGIYAGITVASLYANR